MQCRRTVARDGSGIVRGLPFPPEANGGEYIGPDGFMEMKGYPKVVEPKPQAKDLATAEKLWAVSEQLTGVVYPPQG